MTPDQNVSVAFRGVSGEKLTIKPHAKMQTNDAQSLYRLARAAAGHANVPEFLAEEDCCGACR